MPVPRQPIGRTRIMAHGRHGEPVFADDTGRKLFLETLGEACAGTGWRIHACVLMGTSANWLALGSAIGR